MASVSHRDARVAASSFHMPVNPNTGARVAQYEREDPLEALAAAAAALEEDEEEKVLRATRASADFNTNFSGVDEHMNYEDIVHFSDVYYSNEEYFRKLEELKAAHIETMAKLEKMYQDKLNLKEVQPPIIKEDVPSISSSFISEKNSYQHVPLMTALSEPDLGRSSSLHTSSSEEDMPNLEKYTMMNYAKDLINNMWTDFHVKDYIQYEDTDFQANEKTKKKPKEWVPRITIPAPFQMMIREQKKKEEAMKSKPNIETVHQLLKKQEEDLECKKKFRATPVPVCVLLPLYHDMVKQKEERRRSRKEKNKEALLNSQKPFKFIAREEQKQAAQEKQLKDFFRSKKKSNSFKARPIPRSTYDSNTSDKLKEEEHYRNMKIQPRSQELLQNSSPMPTFRHSKGPGQAGKSRYKHKARYPTHDVEDLPEKYKTGFPGHKDSKLLTGSKPSDLRTSSSASAKREPLLTDIRADEENLKETHWPYQSPRHKSPVRSTSAKIMPCNCNPPAPTVSSRGREQAIRRSLEEKKMLEEERNRILTKQKQRIKELQKLLTTRAKAYDSHQSLAQVFKSKVKYLRKSEKERMREYRQEIEEREEKLKKRPLLFERVAQKNARMAAEKHYSNTLKALGISDEFVSKKGQSGKVFEKFDNQEMKSSTEDKESFNEEEKVEERQNEKENYFIDTSSQDSCKEENENGEESAEENSVEEQN
ncbi:protein FAM161A isoform 1-T1 [Callospermophilus lateralis]|uniref:protein FAM161A isoform X1 n=2 Tax=Callospermophilus lateralis TaxID=76772 RepID=UPI004038A0D9